MAAKLTIDATISFPEFTPAEILERARQRPWKKFISFPIDIEIAGKVIRDEVSLELILRENDEAN